MCPWNVVFMDGVSSPVELKLAHELEKKELEENFETLRLSLQVNS